MAWLTSCTFYTVSQLSWVETQYRVFGGGVDTYTRLHTVTIEEAPGVTQATATDYVTANPAGTGTIISCRAERMNDAAAYKVIKESETVGAWGLVT